MFKHCDTDDRYITLHDCHAEKMSFDNSILSFTFPDGFWVMDQHPHNKSDHTVRTGLTQVDFQIIDEEIDGITIYIFRKGKTGKAVREEWEPANFMSAVNSGNYRVEFITQYKSYQSFLFKCWVWFNHSPHHAECEIILHSENVAYRWNELCYDRIW